MKNIIIIYPHWPPSNLAGVHRARLIANFLPELGWHPIMLCVKEEFYEETLDPDIIKTVAPEIEIIKTDASPVLHLFGKRLVGDLGIRAFRQLYNAALEIARTRAIDFIWIPIPSWYPALLGPLLHRKTGIPYGIDYIDPWVSQLAPYDRVFSRAWWVKQLAKLLEPIAVKKASIISGVSTPYYQPVLDRNFQNKSIVHVGMPYGFDPGDHQIHLKNIDYPWPTDGSVEPYVYAGAFLPQSFRFIQGLFLSIARLRRENNWPEKAHFYFLGTGFYGGTTIADYARQAGVSELVTEIRQRFPFLHIQQFLRSAKGVIIIGSTERHYTASKTFQCLLSHRPVWAIFHEASTAADILEKCQADRYLVYYKDNIDEAQLDEKIYQKLKAYFHQVSKWQPDLNPLNSYSSKVSAESLINSIEAVLSK